MIVLKILSDNIWKARLKLLYIMTVPGKDHAYQTLLRFIDEVVNNDMQTKPIWRNNIHKEFVCLHQTEILTTIFGT